MQLKCGNTAYSFSQPTGRDSPELIELPNPEDYVDVDGDRAEVFGSRYRVWRCSADCTHEHQNLLSEDQYADLDMTSEEIDLSALSGMVMSLL